MKLTGGVPLRKGWELLATQPLQVDGEVAVRTGNTVTLVDVIGEPCDVRCFDRRVCAWISRGAGSHGRVRGGGASVLSGVRGNAMSAGAGSVSSGTYWCPR